MAVALRMTFQPYGNAPSFTIDVLSINFDAVQTLNIGSQSTGAGAGRATFNPFAFTKKPDSHSAEAWVRMCSGTPYQKVVLEISTSAGGPAFFTFTMGLVAIKTIAVAASTGDGSPLETVSVEYGQSAYSAASQNPDGSFGKSVASGWDRIKNTSIDPGKVGTA